MLESPADDFKLTAGHGSRHQVARSFDTIRHDRVIDFVPLVRALHTDPMCSRAFDFSTHRTQECRQIDYFRFAGSVDDFGFTLGAGRRHQRCVRRADRRRCKRNPIAL